VEGIKERCLVPVIAIDGPTASGKGTIASRVAKALGFHYLDSGILYRAVAYCALKSGVIAQDEAQLVHIAETMQMKMVEGEVWLEEEPITLLLREQRCGERASQIAVLPKLRQALLDYQRNCIVSPGLVADGRDMGSVVFPDAKMKIFLTASAEVRAYRRFRQLLEHGFSANLSQIVLEIHERDQRDSERACAPLRRVPGAWLLDTSGLSVEQVVKKILHRFSRLSG
jgi:cytidylate kinase